MICESIQEEQEPVAIKKKGRRKKVICDKEQEVKKQDITSCPKPNSKKTKITKRTKCKFYI